MLRGYGMAKPGERSVVVDAFIVDGFDGECGDTAVSLKAARDIADHVLDEDRIVVAGHRDIPLVGTFEQRIHRARCSCLGHSDELFDPDQFKLAVA
jgi:hypothetical protein